MKYLAMLWSVLLLLQSCAHRTLPTKNSYPTTAAVTPPASVAFIVVDGMGTIKTPKSKLPPSVAQKVNYTSIARAFTPNQRKNLMYRFHTIPPKIIYVSPAFTQHSLKGTYCVYKKQFWYWQQADGLFYLDATYYN
jgi:hypothetical protein